MSVESKKETIRAFFGEVVSQLRAELLDQIAAEDFLCHDGTVDV